MIVKRASAGAEGFVLDHYNHAAVDRHLQVVGKRLMQAFGPNSPFRIALPWGLMGSVKLVAH